MPISALRGSVGIHLVIGKTKSNHTQAVLVLISKVFVGGHTKALDTAFQSARFLLKKRIEFIEGEILMPRSTAPRGWGALRKSMLRRGLLRRKLLRRELLMRRVALRVALRWVLITLFSTKDKLLAQEDSDYTARHKKEHLRGGGLEKSISERKKKKKKNGHDSTLAEVRIAEVGKGRILLEAGILVEDNHL